MIVEHWNEFLEAVMTQLRSKGSVDQKLLADEFPGVDTLWLETAQNLGAFFRVSQGATVRMRQRVAGCAPAIERLWEQITVGQLFATVTPTQAQQHGVSPTALVRLKRDQTLVCDVRTPQQQMSLSTRLGVPAASFVTLFSDALDSEGAEPVALGKLFAARPDPTAPMDPPRGDGENHD